MKNAILLAFILPVTITVTILALMLPESAKQEQELISTFTEVCQSVGGKTVNDGTKLQCLK